MESPFPRETVKINRADVLSALNRTMLCPVRPVAPPPVAPPPVAALALAALPSVVVAPPSMVAPRPAMAAPAPPAIKACAPTNDPRLMMLADPNGAQAAGFRLLRDTLISKGLPPVVAVSSPLAGEGKTTCAINLALALAEHHGRVLLLDATFAAPALPGILGIDDTSTDPLQARLWSAPFMLSALTPAVHVATVARRPGQPASIVDFTTFSRVLESAQRAGYRHIIIDAPPLQSSPEMELLLHLAGGVLLAVRAGSSTTAALRRAVERIGREKALGVSLMDAPA